MGLFGFFKGRDPLKQEKHGDALYESGAFGQAKLEYEAALEKRRKETANDFRIPGLQEKIIRCREGLALDHKKRGSDLAEAGHLDDAEEYYTLAMDLTQDAGLAAELESCKRAIENRQADTYRGEPQEDADESKYEIEVRSIPESEEEYEDALFNTLPDEIRELYLGYGSSFKNGYVALNRGRFDTAVEQLSRALEENPGTESYVRLELATAHLNLKNSEEARILLEEFIAHHQDELPAYRMLCEIYWETDRFDCALKLLNSLSDVQRESPGYCLLRGETLFRAQEYTQAASHYSDFINEYGWDADVARALADTYAAAGNLENARNLYGKILGSCAGCYAPADPLMLRKFADLCMATGVLDEKILEIYLSLAALDPANAAGHYQNVSRIYAALGHEKESKRYRQIALSYGGCDNPGQ